jgi:ABC-type amino acid transport substrate-binding protein
MTDVDAVRRRFSSVLALVVVLALAVVVAACGGGGDSKPASGADAGSDSGSKPAASVKPPAKLVSPGKLTLGTDFTYPPYEYIEDGKQKGFDAELAKLIADLMGLELDQVDTRFASLLPSLASGKFDAIQSSMYVTAKRAKEVDFIAYQTTRNAFVVKADGNFQPKQPADVCGKKVAVLQGSVQEELAGGKFKTDCGGKLDVKSFPTDDGAFAEVVAGRADTLLTDYAVANYRIEKLKGMAISNADQEPLFPSPLGITLPKTGAEDVKRAYEEALAKLEESGELPALRDKYGIKAADPALVEKALAGTLGY